MHGVSALVEDLHVGLQDVEVEGRCQQAAVPAPLVTSAEQQPISYAQEMGVRTLQDNLTSASLFPVPPEGYPVPSSPSQAASGSHRKGHP